MCVQSKYSFDTLLMEGTSDTYAQGTWGLVGVGEHNVACVSGNAGTWRRVKSPPCS